MGIKPSEFYDLTPKDITEYSEGYELSQKRQEIRDAHMIGMLLSPHMKKNSKSTIGDFIIKWKDKIAPKKSRKQEINGRDKVAARFE